MEIRKIDIMSDFNIDDILIHASYKHPKGYLNLEDKPDISFLENILYEQRVPSYLIEEFIYNLTERTGTNTVVNALIDRINSAIDDPNGIAQKEIINNINNLSLQEIKKVLRFSSENHTMVEFVNFINSNSNIEKQLSYVGRYSNEHVGRGETPCLICLNGARRGGGQADLIIQNGKTWEVKESVGLSTFRTGGKTKPVITKLVRFMWQLNDWLTEPKYEKTLNRLFVDTDEFNGENIAQIWRSMIIMTSNRGEITFSEIGKAKYNNVFEFIVRFKNALKELDNLKNLGDTEKAEVLRIKGMDKIFKVVPGTKDKLKRTKVGKKIDISLKPDMTDTDETFLDSFNVLSKNPLLHVTKKVEELAQEIETSIKREFIENYTGGLLFVHSSTKTKSDLTYYSFTPKQFYDNFEFAGITQSNVPKFKFVKR